MFTTSANFTAEILGELSNHQKRIESTVAVMDFLCLFVHVFAHLPLCMGLSIVSCLDKSIQLIASLYPFVFLSLWLFKSHFSTKFSAPPETSEEVQPCLSWNCLTFDFLVRGCIYHAALVHRLKRNHHVHWGYVCKFIEVDKKPGEWRSVPWPVEDMGQADQESQSRPGLLMYSWEMLRDVERCWESQSMLKPEDMSVRLSSSGKARWIWWVDEIWRLFSLCVLRVLCLPGTSQSLSQLRPANVAQNSWRHHLARLADNQCETRKRTIHIRTLDFRYLPYLHLRFRYFQILCSICCRTVLTGLTRFDYLDLSSISFALKLTLIKIDWNSTDVMCLRASQSPSYCN